MKFAEVRRFIVDVRIDEQNWHASETTWSRKGKTKGGRNWLVSRLYGVAAHATWGCRNASFVLAACRLGCKQWRKSCIVAARIVSRKAVTLSSGSCALPTSPYPGSLAIPFSWFQGWKGPPIPATDTYVSVEKANSEISFTEYYLSKRMAGLFLMLPLTH